MTWRTIVAIAVFVGVCGFIAYWGDMLGRRLGKRRLSLFGMRPRYTAIVTTTITGMIIAILTISFMMIASEQARILILQGEKLIRQNKVYRKEYIAAKEAIERATKELTRQQEFVAEARRKAEDAVKQRDKLVAEIASLRKDLKTLKSDLSRNRAELEQRKAELAHSNEQLRQAKAELAARLIEVEKRKKEVAELAKRAEAYWGSLEAKGRQYAAMRQKTVIFRSNQEIVRKVVNCADSKANIRSQLVSLLNEASQRAETLGAKVGENGRAVEIYPKEIVSSNSGQRRFATEAENIDAVVDEISEGIGTVVVRLISADNAIEGETTLVDFVLNYNRLIYAPGDEVASTIINGNASRGEILGQLISFLKGEVRSAAIGKGVIPTYDEDGQMSVVEIPGEQLLETVDKIKSTGKPVEVRAIAKTQIWSADPVTLNFIIGEPS
ncbi:MAG: DUF3084 domain-containing protein [Armatimonadetes bacterium]|nr:DUF3084 domain-containing protein [Armatimonadota bacterium]